MARVELLRPTLDASGLAALGAEWRALEARAAPGTVFRSWTWVGCRAGERFPRPVLLRATAEGRTVGLALFTARRRRGWPALWLGESGNPQLDRVFVEHNGVLAEPGWADALPRWLRTAMRAPLAGSRAPLPARRTLVLGGVDDQHLAAARAVGVVRVTATRPAPYVDLGRLGPAADGYLDTLSRNTRQQLRRSDRLYGPVQVTRAAAGEAGDFLQALLALHARSWAASGRESSLARPEVARFLHDLVAAGLPRGEVDLLRVAAGSRAVGYLLNLRRGSWVGQYQGGFDYEGAGPQHKPGLTCHHAAIRFYAAQGAAEYDFLAGEDRYKRSLAGDARAMHWAEMAPPLSIRGVAIKFRGNFVAR